MTWLLSITLTSLRPIEAVVIHIHVEVIPVPVRVLVELIIVVVKVHFIMTAPQREGIVVDNVPYSLHLYKADKAPRSN